jgi:isopenicillin N synthase-like dioxygenase
MNIMQSTAGSLHSNLSVVSSMQVEALTSPQERQSSVELIRAALVDVGCFVLRIEGAGSVVDAATRQWRRFYALPNSTKQLCRAEAEEGGGWSQLRDEPVYMSHMNASELEASRCKEQFCCQANTDHGLWPRENTSPEFRREVSACADRLGESARALLAHFETLLGQEPGFLRHEPGYLTLTSYPGSSPSTARQGEAKGSDEIGLGEHSDAVVFTMLRQTAAALQVHASGDWQTVPVLDDDCFLVIPGDWMELFSNGAIPAIRHRVLELAHDREAVVFFQNVAPMRVGPLAHFLRCGEKARYPTVNSDIPYTDGAAGVPRWQTHTSPAHARKEALL